MGVFSDVNGQIVDRHTLNLFIGGEPTEGCGIRVIGHLMEGGSLAILRIGVFIFSIAVQIIAADLTEDPVRRID